MVVKYGGLYMFNSLATLTLLSIIVPSGGFSFVLVMGGVPDVRLKLM
jgi:hypothetical protein